MSLNVCVIMIWILLVVLLAGCGLSDTKPEPPHCIKIWDKERDRVDDECIKRSQSVNL